MSDRKKNVSKIKDPDLKARWVATLRSGKYIQGKYKLKRQNQFEDQPSFCCLGVLCDIVAPDGWNDGNDHSFNGKSTQEAYPNEQRMIEFGIYPSTMKKLGIMNDDQGKDFNQIADYIEEHL